MNGISDRGLADYETGNHEGRKIPGATTILFDLRLEPKKIGTEESTIQVISSAGIAKEKPQRFLPTRSHPLWGFTCPLFPYARQNQARVTEPPAGENPKLFVPQAYLYFSSADFQSHKSI